MREGHVIFLEKASWGKKKLHNIFQITKSPYWGFIAKNKQSRVEKERWYFTDFQYIYTMSQKNISLPIFLILKKVKYISLIIILLIFISALLAIRIIFHSLVTFKFACIFWGFWNHKCIYGRYIAIIFHHRIDVAERVKAWYLWQTLFNCCLDSWHLPSF